MARSLSPKGFFNHNDSQGNALLRPKLEMSISYNGCALIKNKMYMFLVSKWLKLKGYKSLQMETPPESYGFYKKYGYTGMPFNDPEGQFGKDCGIPMGKIL